VLNMEEVSIPRYRSGIRLEELKTTVKTSEPLPSHETSTY